MSDVSVDIIKNRSGEAPDLPSGANLSGVSTAATLQVTNLNPTHINTSGVTTATTFSGSLKSTGTPTLGLGVTINSSGLNISGVATAGIVSATTLYGDGSNLTGVAMSIAPISYNPDVNDSRVFPGSGIGITFTERIKAGSGNITLSIATNAGAAGTVVENYGVGSSVTINNNQITIDPTADLSEKETYHISFPAGSFTNTAGDVDYVGTAYTFGAVNYAIELWGWGDNNLGELGVNDRTRRSSPTQVPGTNWNLVSKANEFGMATKTDNTLWVWGENWYGELGLNSRVSYSSPVQLPGSWSSISTAEYTGMGVKTNGTLWSWGHNEYGELGLNSRTNYSSPVQVGSDTNWAATIPFAGTRRMAATKTDGTLWVMGQGDDGELAQNNRTNYSSPVQIPGTTWGTDIVGKVAGSGDSAGWIKTDGTLWTWGLNGIGMLGQNQAPAQLSGTSSPVQIPGTTWKSVDSSGACMGATKTDGTLWTWGFNEYGQLGQNNNIMYSSPTQVGSDTDWDIIKNSGNSAFMVTKTDGTLWSWGLNAYGCLGHNIQHDAGDVSSPVQVPGTTWSLEGVASSQPNGAWAMAKKKS